MKIVVFLFCSIIGFSSKAQLDFGFSGKKNLFAISTQSSFNFIYKFQKDDFFSENATYPIARLNYRFEYQRLVANNRSIGIEVGYKNTNAGLVRYLKNYFVDGKDYSFEMIPKYNTFSIVPNISFGVNNYIGFKGLSFQFGMGIVTHKMNIDATEFTSNFTNDLKDVLPGGEIRRYFGMSMFMQVQNRFLLAEGLFLDIGGRVSVEPMIGKKGYKNSSILFDLSEIKYDESVERQDLQDVGIFHILSFKLGLAYQF